MSDKLTPERRREQTRGALIDSARRAFAQKGFEGASLDEIAADAGFTRGAIYKHFTNKEDLFFAVLSAFNERTLASFADLIHDDLAAATDPASIARMLVSSVTSDPDLWALTIESMLYEYRNPESRQRSVERRHLNLETTARFLEENAEANDFKLQVPAETAAAILLITSDGFTHAAKFDPDIEHLYAKFLELFLPAIVEFPKPN